MRHAGDVKHRVIVFQRIKSGVIPKRAFRAHFAQVHIAFQHDLRVRRHFEIDRLALHHFHRLAPQKSREHEFVEIGRQRQNRRIHGRRIGADRHRHINLPSLFFARARGNVRRHVYASASAFRWCARRTLACGSSRQLRLPVSGFLVITSRPSDISPAVLRPALQNGKIVQRKVLCAHHFLAIAARNDFRKERPNLGQLRQHLQFSEQALRRLHLAEMTICAARLRPANQPQAPDSSAARCRPDLSPPESSSPSAFRTAAPGRPIFTARSVISVISSTGSTSAGNPLQLPFLLQLPHKFPQIPVRHFSSTSDRQSLGSSNESPTLPRLALLKISTHSSYRHFPIASTHYR